MGKVAVRVDLLWIVAVVAGVFLMSGCGGVGLAPQGAKSALIPADWQGVVHGGQQPVSGATVQLYTVGTSGDGSAATALLAPAVTTDANGGFTLTGKYTCPSASALVYVVATGGNPGLGGTVNNAALALMAALGPCGNLTGSTYIVINELTTVAAVYSLAPYTGSATAVGSGASEQTGLASAFTLAAELVNTATGTSPGTSIPAGATVPVAQIDTIADIVASCVNSTGGTSGDGSACGTLFAMTTPAATPATSPATNTIVALLNLANHPSLNTAGLYGLVVSTPPFLPVQTLAPSDFAVQMNAPTFSVSPDSVSFGSRTTGFTSTVETVTLTNSGSAAVTLGTATISGVNGDDFGFASLPSGTCIESLAPGSSCTYQIDFMPSANGARD
jgi:hypothetical protein